MEEKFLKSRQERDEQRQQRTKEGVEASVQRQQYEAEAEQLEAAVDQLLAKHQVDESQQRIDALRKLVQDTANSISLTAHDMAKANAILARLQQRVDDARSATAGPKKFKFSSRLKSKAVADGEAAATPSSSANARESDTAITVTSTASSTARVSSSAGVGNTYGPCTAAEVFIAHSKGVFVSGCTQCTIYCLPIAGSVFLSNCVDCRVYVACHQLRLKDCKGTDIYVWCASTPIIESCDAMRFGPYRCWTGLLQSRTPAGAAYATHEEWVRCVGEIAATAQTEQNYTAVDDFQWVRKTASPHWRLLTASEQTCSSTVFGPATPPNQATE